MSKFKQIRACEGKYKSLGTPLPQVATLDMAVVTDIVHTLPPHILLSACPASASELRSRLLAPVHHSL